MANRLAGAISPYLRSHADNPVDWWPWSEDAFAEAERRDVPVLVSIGYSTCHWCHVMARESFGNPGLAAYLNAHFVAIKVDREEHPEVDASYLAAAGAFTPHLGWPLNVFVTPMGRAFFAGTYFPPDAGAGQASFRQVLEAVSDAWTDRRDQVEETAARVAEAIAATRERGDGGADARHPLDSTRQVDGTRHGDAFGPASAAGGDRLGKSELALAARTVAETEDPDFGGFGGAPKFPVAPLLSFLLRESAGAPAGRRALKAMAASPLRDPVDGGFFRYATRRDWSDPHYERMLYDNAVLLDDYTTAWRAEPGASEWVLEPADGIARFLTGVLQLPDGGFASAQDSESVVDGRRVEGHYYHADAGSRAELQAPALDRKVLTGWNGLAIGALARAGFAFARPDWIESSRRAADFLLAQHRIDGVLVRASESGRLSHAPATLEDYGGLADGLIALALATGEVRYANAARELIDLLLGFPQPHDGHGSGSASRPRMGAEPFAVPDGSDPVLSVRGLGIGIDATDGATPSGIALAARASYALFLLAGDRVYLDAAVAVVALVRSAASEHPSGHGYTLALAHDLRSGPTQLVMVRADGDADSDGTESGLLDLVRRVDAQVVAVVSDSQARAFSAAGFELFEGRTASRHRDTAYLCRNFVCSLPVHGAEELRAELPI